MKKTRNNKKNKLKLINAIKSFASRDKTAKELIKQGVDKVADAVKVTLGAKGRNVMLSNGAITKDGVTVARDFLTKSLGLGEDAIVNMGANTIVEAAARTNNEAGDGTSTSMVLAQAIINEGMKVLRDANINPFDLNAKISKDVEAVINNLKQQAKKVNTYEDLKNVATISANNDAELGEIIADAFESVDRTGVVTFDESPDLKTSLEEIDGIKINKGLASPMSITNQVKMICEYDNPNILITNKTIHSFREILHLVEHSLKTGHPIVIFCEKADGEAFREINGNAQQGIAVVEAPEYGMLRNEILSDLAVQTGATLLKEETGDVLIDQQVSVLGAAKKITISSDSTLISEGKGDKKEVQKLIKETEDREQNEGTKLRLARLKAKFAVVNVGGKTQSEMIERKERVEDAINATRAAIEEGIVEGGGVALLKAHFDFDEGVIRTAITEPYKQILSNAGVSKEEWYGESYNVKTGKIEDFFETGVIDPVKVTRCALENAASIAKLILTTEAVIYND
jgi:chaperonin GroEL